MKDQMTQELNWSITEHGLDVSLDKDGEPLIGIALDVATIREAVEDDVKDYMDGKTSSEDLDEWMDLRRNLLMMAKTINAQLAEVYHEDTA